MKTYDERSQMVASKLKNMKKHRKAVVRATSLGLVCTVLALVLFLPLDLFAPSTFAYSGSEYYPVIRQINKLTWNKPGYKNNFEILANSFSNTLRDGLTGGLNGEATPAPGAPTYGPLGGAFNEAESENGSYEEVTDNQVAGVTEADIIKRSDKYIYYLSTDEFLGIYSIAKEESTYAGGINVMEKLYPDDDQRQRDWAYGSEMYLSTDCTTVTLVMNVYKQKAGASVLLVNLDVTDPANIQLIDHVCFPGDLVSTRMVDGDLLLTYRYYVDQSELDFNIPETFVPTYGKEDDMQCIPGSDIICPENADVSRYTVICKLDGKSLQVHDTAALLSYSEDLYVSADTIYATHTYNDVTETKDGRMSVSKTDITGICYTGDKLEMLGTVTLDGSVKDQYSMDQHNGILRVVTSTNQTLALYNGWDDLSVSVGRSKDNVNLYCVDLAQWSIRSSVIAFAPEGEEATAVRFNGDSAYVCTAEIIVLTDPVYFFDLSDPDNITWTDTGTIDGYSTSLIDLGDGYLAGIGYNENRMLKIEIYKEGEHGVDSVTSFELDAEFSEVYKSYLIDREKDLIGLGIYEFGMSHRYILLQFNGYELVEVSSVPMDNHRMDRVRGVLVDGYLYVLQAQINDIIVHPVWGTPAEKK